MNTTISNDAVLIAELALIGQLLTRYILLVMVILNLVGNTLNILVFSRRKLLSSPCTVYLLAAACFNIVWTIAAVVPRILSTFNLDFSAQLSPLCKIRHFIFFSFASFSIWMMVLASVDRFLISSPSAKYRQFSSFSNTYRMIGIITVILCANYSNLFYCANIKGKPPSSSCTSVTSQVCGFYNELSRIMTNAILPGSVIFVFGLGTVKHLKKLRTAVGTTSTSAAQPQFRMRKTDHELIRMLIGQVVLILFSWFPHAAERLYTVITFNVVKTSLRSTQDTLWDQIMWIVTTLDSSLSFYVYLFTGGVLFRQTLRQIFRTPETLPNNTTSVPRGTIN